MKNVLNQSLSLVNSVTMSGRRTKYRIDEDFVTDLNKVGFQGHVFKNAEYIYKKDISLFSNLLLNKLETTLNRKTFPIFYHIIL